MKNKYQRFSKEEKKKCKELFYQTPKGREMRLRLTRLSLTGIIGLMFSVFIITNDKRNNTLGFLSWVLFTVLLIFSIIFLIASFKLKRKCLNDYAVKHMK